MKNLKRNLYISSLSCLYLFLTLMICNSGRAMNRYPVDAKVSSTGPAKQQTVTKKVMAHALARPGVYWYQLDNGSWKADQTDQVMHYYTANVGGNCTKPVPADQEITVKVNMQNYKPGKFEDKSRNQILQTAVTNVKINAAASKFVRQNFSYKPVGNFQVLNNMFIWMRVITGNSYKPAFIKPTNKKQSNTCNKHLAMYPVYIELRWEGIATETKEIRVLQDSAQSSVLQVGERKHVKAEVQTKEFTAKIVDPKQWTDISARVETTWSSDKPAVAAVDVQGKVTAVAAGTATITAQWKSGLYWLSSSTTVIVGSGAPPTTMSPFTSLISTSVGCTDPMPTAYLDGKYMDPLVSAAIKAEPRGNERFDVLRGIPTSESLYGQVGSRNYLFQHKFVKMAGTCTYRVDVKKTYTLKWNPGKTTTGPDGTLKQQPDLQTETETKVYTVTVERPYSFWAIDTLHVFHIDKVSLVNDALPNGRIHIMPIRYTPPRYVAATRGRYYAAAHPGIVTAAPEMKTGGRTKPIITDDENTLKLYAERAVGQIEVENDYLQFNDLTIIDDRRVTENGPTPRQIPTPTFIGTDVLYSPGNKIPSSKVNRVNTPSSGNITYKLMSGNINGGQDQSYPISDINPITVHTPVVMYSKVSDDRAYNQKTNPNPKQASFILGRPFAVYMPTSGQHLDLLGYGKRSYAKYVRTKEVKFPFDAYSFDRSLFYPKHTWIQVPVYQERVDFFLPVWVNEGNYTIKFRTTAENAPPNRMSQRQANTQIAHHQAIDTVPVEVMGRLYDFNITDISDYNWETVFRKQKGSNEHTGILYWVGQNGVDGIARGNGSRYTLPIVRGSHPLFQNVVIKSGYRFAFDVKTKGNLFHQQDIIVIIPRFYFVDKKGNKRREVDVYYHTENKYFIKIGSKQDKVKLYLRHDDPLRHIPKQALIQTAAYQYYYDLRKNKGQTLGEYTKQFLYHRNQKMIWAGDYAKIILSPNLRTFIGPTTFPTVKAIPEGVDRYRVLAAEQQWYGGYCVPTPCWVVEKGFNIAEYGRTHNGIRERDPIFLRDGFIIINFNIVAVRNGVMGHPHLQYINAPWSNQWQREGSKSAVTDSYGATFQLLDGDVVFYDADVSINNDFRAAGTH